MLLNEIYYLLKKYCTSELQTLAQVAKSTLLNKSNFIDDNSMVTKQMANAFSELFELFTKPLQSTDF